MQQDKIFTLTIEAQDMVVHYRPRYFVTADYAHFEFTSPHQPPRRIPVSETGYRSHFSPIHEIEAAPSVEAYAHALAIAIMHGTPCTDEDVAQGKQVSQLTLF